MVYRPGHTPWNKGKIKQLSMKLLRKRGRKKGFKASPEIIRKMTGWKHSEESKKKMRGNKNAIGGGMKGKVFSLEHRKKISESRRGEKNWHWKGGISSINKKIRNSFEMKLWRKAVFARDNYTCIWCGDNRGGNLEADHIKPFCDYPELRFSIDNGRTLCKECHRKTDTWGGRSNRVL